ncbi:MAG: alpha-L-rhamnosidase N-terminal domain-containing protein [Anaerolineales bacterium]|nr:alpha-L-rhamnosidase N-terminal domain-containing protein [Anaerolineales bacterium]
MKNVVTPADFSEIRWRGHWIWVPEEPIVPGPAFGLDPHFQAKESHGLFRKTVHLDQVPSRVPARIAADSRYALFVNGEAVYRGPIRSQPRRMHYDLFDLAPFLQPGANVLAVYVRYYGSPKSFWQPAVPNMTLGKSGVMVFEADFGPAGWIVSDESWKARKSDAWDSTWQTEATGHVAGGVPLEVFDARQLPHNWHSADFDDSNWGNAHFVPAMHIGGFARTQPPTDPYGPLFPRPIAQLDGARQQPAHIQTATLTGQIDPAIGDPVRRVEAALEFPAISTDESTLPLTLDIPANGCARLIFDMGRIVSGLVQFSLEAPAGTILDFSYVEIPITGPSRFLGQHAGTRYIARGAHDQLQVFDSNGFRYAYLVVHGVAGSVILTDFAVQEHVYPWQEGASFSCSDDELNRIFTAGIRTVQLNSHDAFIDCPTREQRAWVGDSVVHQMVHFATNTDWRLAQHYLTLGNSPRSDGVLPMSVVGDVEADGGLTIPDWALHWVHGVYNLYRFVGDRDAVKEFMPGIEKVLRWYAPYQTSAGVLKDVVEWNLVDWSSVHVEDTPSLLNALWARGLREFAEMAAWLEEKGSQRWAEGLYEKVRVGFEMFWDEQRGTYVDHVVDGQQRPEMSQLAGALAIVSGLAPQSRWGRIVDVITDAERLVVRSWTGDDGDYAEEKMAKQFQGIYTTDWDAENEIVIAEPFMSYVVHDAVALAGLAARLPDLYPRWSEFLVDGYDTIGECWGWGTHVHGWSCAPTRDMVFYTLGVTPAEPGYTKVRIAPRLGRLAWAKGAIPTPHGLVTVSVGAESVTVDSPIPLIVDLENQPPRTLDAGQHQISK